MKKKVSLPIVITIALISAAIAFTAAYLVATKAMNSRLTDLGEKQALFSTLSDVDAYIRENYEGEIDEENLTKELCQGYAQAFDGKVLYLSEAEYNESSYKSDPNVKVMVLADGSAMVVLSAEAPDVQDTTADGDASSQADYVQSEENSQSTAMLE